MIRCDVYENQCQFSDEIKWLYTSCGITLISEETGEEASLDTALYYECRDCYGHCGYAYMDENDCEGATECTNALCVIPDFSDDDDGYDDDDDSTGNPDAPALVDAYWQPDTFDMVEACLDPESPCTALIWEVCDPNGDLSGGYIHIYQAGTDIPAFGEDHPWNDFLDGSPVDDCTKPYATGKNVIFPGTLDAWCPDSGQFYIGVDIEVTDGAMNFSNMITDAEVVWNCE
jgi:hypothetical protein